MVDFGNAGAWARELCIKYIPEGGRVIDATMGNGHDTLTLASLVGENGRVWAFDVQQKALENTKKRLEEAGVQQRVTLIQDDHANMEKYVAGSVDAVIFNLGWLPGAEHTVTTHIESTLTAADAGLRLLKTGGLMTVCVYPGHAEGMRELEALTEWAKALDDREFDAVSRGYENIRLRPPRLFMVAKKQ